MNTPAPETPPVTTIEEDDKNPLAPRMRAFKRITAALADLPPSEVKIVLTSITALYAE
jgi:hypothetical protein